MVRANILLIIIFLIKFSAAANLLNSTKDADHCFRKKCIHKCCPIGEYPRKNTCTKHAARVDFSGLVVYDEKVRDTGRKVQNEFTILDGKFVNNSVFQTYIGHLTDELGYIPYVKESGVLTLEMPNAYPRWEHVPNDNFCVDYVVTKSGGLTNKPRFFIVQSCDESTTQSTGEKVYSTGTLLVSCIFLLLVLVVYILMPELQNLGGQILMSYVASLFTAFMTMAILLLGEYEIYGCVTLTFFLYFSFLAAFCWMSVMSYDIWWTFSYAKARPIHRRGDRFKFLMYCLCAWGVPLLMSIFMVVVATTDMRRWPWFITPQIPKKGCFLADKEGMFYLYIPMLILIVCNWMFYLMTAFNIWRLSRGTAVLDTAAAGTPSAHRSQRHRFMVYVKLSVVMGLNWVFEIIGFIMWPHLNYVWHVTDFCHMLVGIAIFVIFVCKKKIYRKLYERYASSVGSSSSRQETVELPVCANPKGNGYTASKQ